MQTIQSAAKRCHAYLKARPLLQRRARIAAIALLILLALFLALHPYGTKTYLVMGIDNYGSLDAVGRSDVMMLVQLDFTRLRISTVTFARDMMIRDSRGGTSKINTIARTSGEDALVESIEQNFGVRIDGWFRVNFASVVQLVDAIGGAKVELTSKEASYIDSTIGKYDDHPLSEGVCQLNGAQALCYARCRKLDNDIGRGQRQSKLMAAMVQSTRHMTMANVVSVFSSLKHVWRSSLSGAQQVSLLGKAIWLRGAKVSSVGVPFEGTWSYGDGGIKANIEKNRSMLLDALGLPDAVTQ